jgi:predicted CXXCH cytochrome family protein
MTLFRSEVRLDPRGEQRCGTGGVSSRLRATCAALLMIGSCALRSEAAKAPETIDPAASCVSGGCHSFVQDYDHLHWPSFSDAAECRRCHTGEGDLHEFETEEPPDLCAGCHEDLAKRMAKDKRVHEPAEDDCLDCHDPHGGDVKAMLEDADGEDLKELCFTCHDEDILEGKFTHGPADQGSCNVCHDPHSSANRHLLRTRGIGLCAECHEEVADEVLTASYVHDPAKKDCVDCHNPHSSDHPAMLAEEKRAQCNECHSKIVELAETSKVRHSPALTGEECLGCHSPHAAATAANLKKPQLELCLDCHDKPIRAGNSVLVDMKSWLAEKPSWHEPVREGDCTGCHDPHGSQHFRLLQKPFPERFYTPFKVRKYGLCFSCHEVAMVTARQTRSETGFRNGSTNLHFLHVNRARRGRSCRACHEIHANENPLQVRDSVPFGRWSMPINFQKQETGGSCMPGCHQMQKYDRGAEDQPGAQTASQ